MLHPAVNLLHNSLLDAPLLLDPRPDSPIVGCCSTERGTKIRAQPVNHPLNVPAAHTHRQGHLTQPLIRKLHQRIHCTQTPRQVTAHQSRVRCIPPSFTAPAQSHLYPFDSRISCYDALHCGPPMHPKKPSSSVTETSRQPPAAPQLPNATPPQAPGHGAPPTASSHPTPPQQLPRAAHTHPSFAP